MNSLNLNVNLNFKQIIGLVKQLSPSEKIQLNELMWEDNIDIPESHQKIVLERIESSKTNQDLMLDWEEVSINLKS